jgi:integrase
MDKNIKINAENERIKRKYLNYQKEAGQKSDVTINNIVKSLVRYEEFTDFKPFGSFNKDYAVKFKKCLTNTKNRRNEPLSKSTMLSTIKDLQTFFKWLAYQNGYKSKISLSDIDYLNLSEKDTRMAKEKAYKEYPTIEQIKTVISAMPFNTDIEKRDRALIAFAILTGARDKAIVSLKLKHIKLNKELVIQDPKEVKTKFSKQIYTYFFPVGDKIKQIIIDWINYLKTEKLFNDNSPLFPKEKLMQDKNNSFISAGLDTEHWSSANKVREIFKRAFEIAKLPYFNPHSFRNTLVAYGQEICQTPEEFKAYSQNLGHESPLTTFTSYGYVSEYRQGDIIRNLKKGENQPSMADLMNEIKDLKKSKQIKV